MQMDARSDTRPAPGLPGPVTALPPKIQATIQTRLLRLSPAAQELASVAAVIGRAFTFDVLVQASGNDPDRLVDGLDELWQRRIVREQGSGGYDFSHDRIREVAYAQISLARRRLLHRRVARALEQIHAPQLAEVSGLLAAHYEEAGLAEQAVAWYWQAVEVARRRFATTETIASTRKGLALLATLPETAERQVQQISLSIALAGSLARSVGILQPEVFQIFSAMQLLSQRLGQKFHQYEAQRGLWNCYLNRLLVSKACIQAQENLALALEMQQPRCLRDAYTNMGLAAFEVGEFGQAVGYLEQAIAQQIPADSPRLMVFGFDLGIEAPFLWASTHYLLGYPDQARRRVDEALARIRLSPDFYTRQIILMFASQVYQIARELATVEQTAVEMLDLSARYDLFGVDGAIFREWSLAVQTRSSAAAQSLYDNLQTYQKFEYYQLTYYLGMAAEAFNATGRYAEALAASDTALAQAERSGERFWCAELNRLQGETRLALGEGGVEVCFQTALAIARQQQAKLLELRAALSLGRFWQSQGRGEEARQLVAGVYDWFSEGFATPDLAAARAFLGQVA